MLPKFQMLIMPNASNFTVQDLLISFPPTAKDLCMVWKMSPVFEAGGSVDRKTPDYTINVLLKHLRKMLIFIYNLYIRYSTLDNVIIYLTELIHK